MYQRPEPTATTIILMPLVYYDINKCSVITQANNTPVIRFFMTHALKCRCRRCVKERGWVKRGVLFIGNEKMRDVVNAHVKLNTMQGSMCYYQLH